MSDPRPGVTGLSHVALAVADADAAAAQWAALGAVRGREELLDGGALRVVFMSLGAITFELLEPRDESHTVAKFLRERGPGLHHVSLDVADLDAALEAARRAGLRLVDERARAGAHGSRVAFLHPKSLAGVLVELCQASAPPSALDEEPGGEPPCQGKFD
ncbi:MAG TPA: methylmalonyl-CoA epimerase [Candidatus Eisenbacteria bacterium]|nr:methylmalonyl-CoA epimerase [Candidatus Eisenbacteria bacterium]